MRHPPRHAPDVGRRRGWQLFGAGAALALAALGPAPPAAVSADTEQAAGSSAEPAPLVDVDGGRVTVHVRDAELADVLEQIALRGGFRLRATGQLGLVTAAFDDLSLERALRRLVRDHELMLIYGGPVDAAGEASLLEVAVFAAPPSRRVADRLDPAAVAQRAALLGEINRLARGGQDGAGTARLAELLGGAPDPSVRAHAARILGQVGGAGASAALAAALADQAPGVRVQAASSFRRLEGSRAIPALGRLLLGDPDVTVRRTAARLLDTMRDPAATAALSQAAGDPDAAVRLHVSRSLQRRAPPTR